LAGIEERENLARFFLEQKIKKNLKTNSKIFFSENFSIAIIFF